MARGIGPKGQRKVERVMHEWKQGELRSGSRKGPDVRSRKQAVAIALSEGRRVSRDKPRSS